MANTIASSKNYNPDTLRLDYPSSFLEHMPIRQITDDERYELMCTMAYNPTWYYEGKVQLKPNECGHDDKYRYVLEV